MILIDIHTHNTDANRQYGIFNSAEYVAERNISLGIHPWEITTEWKEVFAVIKEYAYRNNVVAIGECGIDKNRTTADIETQKEVFRAHATLAEESKKPLIIHCVKGFDEIIAIHKEISPRQAWILHGFRGKPQQAEQLIKRGIYISFGEKFNTDTLTTTPLEMMFIESDDNRTAIDKIYTSIAIAKGVSIEELASQIAQNAKKCGIELQK